MKYALISESTLETIREAIDNLEEGKVSEPIDVENMPDISSTEEQS